MTHDNTRLTTLAKFVSPYGPIVKSFKQLTIAQRSAIIVYMADGAWASTVKEVPAGVKRLLALDEVFVKAHGTVQFGVVNIPPLVIKKALAQTESWIAAEYGDVGAYFKRNPESSRRYPSNDWPVILSHGDADFREELIQDGWHRLNVYIHRGIERIPCIYYI